MNISELVARAWESAMRESPDPFRDLGYGWFGGLRLSYRERLDRPVKNWLGEVIPRIVIVRHNLKRLGRPKRKPSLP